MKNMCAVCGDKTQSNVKLQWQRFEDKTVFNVCLACAESGVVNSVSVKMIHSGEYTTFRKCDVLLKSRRPLRPRGSAK